MFRQTLKEIPFLKFLIPLIAGIILSRLLIEYHWIDKRSIVFYLLSIVLLLLYLIFFSKRLKWVNALLINLILLSCGMLLVIGRYPLFNQDHFSKINSAYYLVSVDEPPVVKEKFVRFPARIIYDENGSTLTGKTLLYINRDTLSEQLKYGDNIIIKNNLKEIRAPQNPGEFNYKQFLASKNIFHQQFIKQQEWRRMEGFSGNPVIAFSNSIANRLIHIFRKKLTDDEAFNVASALVIGYRADLSPDIVDSYSNTGTLHILSVSGLHVGIIYIVLQFALSFLDKMKGMRIIKTLILIILVWLYALISGCSPSVCRSAMMITFVIAGKSFNRSTNIYNVIFASAFLLLLYDPLFLYDIGFLLSYLAVISIIYFQPKIQQLIHVENKLLDKLWVLTSVSIAAQIGTFPISLYLFHQFPNYFLIANLVAIPLATVVLYAGIALLITASVPVVGTCMAWLLTWTIKVMDAFLLWVELLPFSSFKRIWINTFEMSVMYLCMAILIVFLVYKNRTVLKYVLVLLIIMSIGRLYTSYHTLRQAKFMVLSDHKNMTALCILGDKAYCFSQDSINTRNKKMHMESLLGMYHINNEYYATSIHLIEYLGKRILFLPDGYTPAEKIEVDYLVTDQHSFKPDFLLQHLDYKTAILTSYIDKNRMQDYKTEHLVMGRAFYSTYHDGVFVSSK